MNRKKSASRERTGSVPVFRRSGGQGAAWRAQPDSLNLMVSLVVGLIVCAPFLFGGRLFLLDWVVGPHTPLITTEILGLGGLTSGAISSLSMSLANQLLGAPATWLPLFLFFPIAMVGAGRLTGRSPLNRLAAGTLYAVNPFVFNRIYVGHLPLLLGDALLPWAVASALRAFSGGRTQWVATTLWWSVLTALSPHFSWVFGLVVLGSLFAHTVVGRHSLRAGVLRLLAITAAYLATNLYIVLPHLVTSLPTTVGQVSLDIYRTTGDSHLGLFVNVLGLYGFWRTAPGPTLPKDIIAGWPFLMAAILLIVIVGVRQGLRSDRDHSASNDARDDQFESTDSTNTESRTSPLPTMLPSVPASTRPLTLTLIFVGVTGYFLALGDQGPTGGIFTWMYDHVPFFAIMREPQKFLVLLALAFAVFFGWGVQRFSHLEEGHPRRRAVVIAVALGVALPLAYTANIFDGLGGQLSSSTIPSAYAQANTLMGTGTGNVLSFPWHLYMAYPFTDGRVVANIAPSTFERPVISGDNVESGPVQTQSTSPRSAYIEGLLSYASQIRAFGALIDPLGVKYVALSKTVDWSSYQWLGHQADLRVILNTPALEVWRNLDYHGVGGGVTKIVAVSGVQELITSANAGQSLGIGSVLRSSATNPATPSTARTPTLSTATSSVAIRRVREISPVAYQILPGSSGWVQVAAPFQKGWSVNGRNAVSTAEGTLLVWVGASGGVLRFSPWSVVRISYLLSGAAFVGLGTLSWWSRRRLKFHR